MSELDCFGIVECHYPYDVDEPMVLMSSAAQRFLGSDIDTSLVPELARRVRKIVSAGAFGDGPDVATLTLDDGRRICGVRGRRAIVLGIPCEDEPKGGNGLAMDSCPGVVGYRKPTQDLPDNGNDVRARFRADFLSPVPCSLAGDVAFREEAIHVLALHQQAIELLVATGASCLAEAYVDDTEMLVALGAVAGVGAE